MATPERYSDHESFSDDERLWLWSMELRERMLDCTKRRSEIEQEWHDLLVQTLDCDRQLRERRVAKIAFLDEYEQPMPESLSGLEEAPVLYIVAPPAADGNASP